MNVHAGGAQWTSHNGQGQFGTITGEFLHEVVLNGPNSEPHARVAVNAGGQTCEGDINVESLETPDGKPGTSPVQYAMKTRNVAALPEDGVHMGQTDSFVKDGLQQSDFQTVGDTSLRQQLIQLAQSSLKMQMSGQVYNNGPGKSGVHDIHMNSGDPTRPQQPDGVVRFYTKAADGGYTETSIYIKFQSQQFPSQRFNIQANQPVGSQAA